MCSSHVQNNQKEIRRNILKRIETNSFFILKKSDTTSKYNLAPNAYASYDDEELCKKFHKLSAEYEFKKIRRQNFLDFRVEKNISPQPLIIFGKIAIPFFVVRSCLLSSF